MSTEPRDAAASDVGTAEARERGPLGVLVDEMASRPPAASLDGMLDDLRRVWSRVRTESQLRQSIVDVPENTGPLNSSALVHRSIALMRELSPGYLQHFLSYVDDLGWMERLGQSAAPADPVRMPAQKKRARAKPKAKPE